MAGDLRDRVEAALRDYLATETASVEAIAEELASLTEAATEFVLGGGKRLRPAFCYWGARAVGTPDSTALVRAAASLELLHACALVHDDVIDRSATRRGRPATHEHFAGLHAERHWAGSAADFGQAIAILLGDLLLVWSDAMFATSGLDRDALQRSRPIAESMRVELMAGQYLDVLEQARGGGSVERALRVARYKAAKYTVERPLHLGVAIGAGPPETFAAFSAFGLPLGEAFQLRDDLLGVFGDPDVTGKPAGDDFREGKRTVLIALAIDGATPTGRAALERHLGDPDLDESGVDALLEVVASTKAAATIESMIVSRVDTAIYSLGAVDLEPAARDALIELAGAATRRAD